MEEPIRRFIKAAGPPPEPTELEWQAFVASARRHAAVRRALTLVAAAALIAGAAVLGGRLSATLRDADALPPANRGAVRIGEGDELPGRCPKAAPAEMAGRLGLVVLLRAGDLYVVDVTNRAERLLIDGVDGYEPRDPSFSFDGRYVATGDGIVVPTNGGPACAPLGADASGVRWTQRGEVVGLRTDGSGLVLARPDGEVRDVRLRSDTLTIGGFAIDRLGEQAALDVHGSTQEPYEGIWVASLTGEQGPPREIYALPRMWLDDQRLEVAAYYPDLGGVLGFQLPRSASLSADGGLLLGMPTVEAPSMGLEITDMLPYRDYITRCGDRIIVAAGAGRSTTFGKRLLALEDFKDRPLTDGGAYTWPSCTAAGQVLATVTQEAAETRIGTLPRALALVSPKDGSEQRTTAPQGRGYEYPLPAGVSDHILVVERVLEPRGPAALVLLDGSGDPLYRVAELGEVGGYYGYYGYSELFDWYNDYLPLRDRR